MQSSCGSIYEGTAMTRRDQMLDALAIGPQWQRREVAPARPSDGPNLSLLPDADAVLAEVQRPALDNRQDSASEGVGRHTDTEIAGMDWAALQSAVSNCTRCDLCRSRTRTVFGAGDPKAKWLFVGEGPGRNEDQQGEPFVGPAGKLLDNMLAAIGLRRGSNAFIANVVKCRPTDASGKDRAPSAEEVAACRPYLARQITLITPDIMIALGKTAAVALLGCEPTIAVSKLRGVVHRYGELPLVVTYHPAYLLRALVDKRKAWEDLCLAMDAHAGAG
ncbi:MAG: uracil-DNA glycosylase [Herminiimonas sp.]|nr:uracil-DNA glycosylase [Herminiimonas sp.]